MKIEYTKQRLYKALTEQPIQLPEVEILNEDQRLFKCWGSVEVKDSQGEIIKMDELKKIMPILMERGGVLMEMHTNKHVGKLLNYEFTEKQTKDEGLKPAMMLTCKVFDNYPYDDYVWDGVKNKRYLGLSFGGFNKTTEYDEDSNANSLVGIEGLEFSLVDNPSCSEATMSEINFFAKGKYKDKVSKGPLCMELLTNKGFSDADAHNTCYADDIESGEREPMIEKVYPKKDESDLSKDDHTNISKGGKTPMANSKNKIKKQDGEEMPETPDITLESLADRMDRFEDGMAEIKTLLAGNSEKREDEGEEEKTEHKDEEEEVDKTAGTGPDPVKDVDVPQDEDESPGDEETNKAPAIKAVEKRISERMDKNFEELKKHLGIKKSTTPRTASTQREDIKKKETAAQSKEVEKQGLAQINPYDIVTGKLNPNLKEFAKSRESKIEKLQREALGYN